MLIVALCTFISCKMFTLILKQVNTEVPIENEKDTVSFILCLIIDFDNDR